VGKKSSSQVGSGKTPKRGASTAGAYLDAPAAIDRFTGAVDDYAVAAKEIALLNRPALIPPIAEVSAAIAASLNRQQQARIDALRAGEYLPAALVRDRAAMDLTLLHRLIYALQTDDCDAVAERWPDVRARLQAVVDALAVGAVGTMGDAGAAPATKPAGCPLDTDTKATHREAQAMYEYDQACEALRDASMSDRQAYSYVYGAYKAAGKPAPSFAAWRRALTRARSKTGAAKRAGRRPATETRSITTGS